MSRRDAAMAGTALVTLFMLGCTSPAPPPASKVDEARLLAAAVPGATGASLLAGFGPAMRQRFDNGTEVWLYLAPANAGRHTELVIQLDSNGIVRKVRRRPPHAFDPQ